MKRVISILVMSIFAFAAQAEPAEQPNVVAVKASDYSIRVGEKLKSFGWRIALNGDKYCEYHSIGVKHLVRADTFDNRQCPDALIGVKQVEKRQGVDGVKI